VSRIAPWKDKEEIMSDLAKEGPEPRARKRFLSWRLLIWVAGILTIAISSIVGAHYLDEFAGSTEFCGTICHADRAQYVTHALSNHANVECGACHIGPGLAPKVLAHVYGVQDLIKEITGNYERPSTHPVSRLRPAAEICEQCHSTQPVYAGRVRLVSRFATDQANTRTDTYITVRTGGGSAPAKNQAHWHTANLVSFVSLDVDHQQIPLVTVTRDGQTVSFRASNSGQTLAELQKLPQKQMDCMDCHNRATHVFRKPEDLLDEALASGRISSGLPYIKKEGLQLLAAFYETQEVGLKAMSGLNEVYSQKYADVYATQRQAIDDAAKVLAEILGQTVFPENGVTWNVYPDNLGHSDFPGCFRCHDGKHLDEQGRAIPLNCNACHSLPSVVAAGQKPTLAALLNDLSGAQQPPESHSSPNWMREHRTQTQASCANCHGAIKYGADDSSFCANSACHGQKWPSVDLKAGFTHPVALTDGHAQAVCSGCHQAEQKPQLQDCAVCHKPPSQPHYGPDCSRCHTTAGWRESAVSWSTSVPGVPHRATKTPDCLTCHGEGQLLPMPTTHKGLPTTGCAQCHLEIPRTGVSPVPHAVEEAQSNCLLCHAAGKLRPQPADHKNWPNESCLLCHDPTTRR
jgi:nitrate/TMAO reductase-like tetraheme cytochrome c subunit